MNRLMMVLVAVACLVVADRAKGGEATTTSVQPIRIGYVDMDRVAGNSQMVKERVSAVEQELLEKQKNFKAKAEELKQLSQEVSQQESVLSAAQLEQKKTRIRTLRDELDRLQYESDRILNKTSQDIIEPVLDEVLAAVERIAKAYGFDLILRGDLVLYASDRVDLTDAVVRELDKKAGTPKPAVSPASTPARRSSDTPESGKAATGGRPATPTPPKKAPKLQD